MKSATNQSATQSEKKTENKSTEPAGQSRPIPSQAEGDRATVEESLRHHEEQGNMPADKSAAKQRQQ